MRLLLIIGLSLSILSSCKKDEDTEAPVIQVTSPEEGFVIYMPDTIAVSATVRDNNELEFIRFGLIDADLNPVGERVNVSVTSNPLSFSLTLDVIDLDITSGLHYLEVSASDGTNDSREFVEVNVFEIPKVFQGVTYLAEGTSGDDIGVTKVDGEQITFFQPAGSGVQYCQSGRDGEVFIASNFDKTLKGYSIITGELSWETMSIASVLDNVLDCKYDQGSRRIVTLNSGPEVRTYSADGHAIGTVSLPNELDVIDIAVDGSYYYISSETSSGFRLSRVFKSSGFEVDSYSLSYEPIMFSLFGDEFLLLIDSNSDIHIVNTLNNDQFDISAANTSGFHSLVVEGDIAFLATGDEIYRVDNTMLQATSIYSSNGITGISYDDVEQRLIVSENGELKFFNPNPWQSLGSLPCPVGASSLEAVFNK